MLLMSCHSDSIVVWSGKDLIGLGLLALILLVVGVAFLVAWIQDGINKRKRKKTTKIKG